MPRLSKIGAAALAAFGWTGLSSVTASYLVVAGGGAGGPLDGGGGGAGGFQTGTTSLNPTQSYTVIVGAGGAGQTFAVTGPAPTGINGSNSQFGSLTVSIGGGGGGSMTSTFSVGQSGATGGSGGGGSYGAGAFGGSGTAGQGNAGGNNNGPAAGGGGGAGGAGSNGVSITQGGAGGVGLANPITGSTAGQLSGGTYYLAGGGGGAADPGTTTQALGGLGGGGNSAFSRLNNGTAGTANTGGGGGGGVGGSSNTGYSGGSGVVIISYPSPQKFGGGIVTTSGANTIHTFQTSGTLSPLSSLTANFLVVAGGASGGGFSGGFGGAGGGAGGLRSSVTNTGGGGSLEPAVTIDTNSIYIVTVGAGGAAVSASGTSGNNGSNSVFNAITSTGGGGGGTSNGNGVAGGSGGGVGGRSTSGTGTAGTGTANQGFAGGVAFAYANDSTIQAGGGGGAGAVGVNATSTVAGNGGAGVAVAISGTSVTYAGGGGGSTYQETLGSGGSGGGGNGAKFTTSTAATSGTANTGSGGGGGNTSGGSSGAGGSGIVIISYAGSTQLMAGGTVTISGGNVIHTFTSSGYLTPLRLVGNSLRLRGSATAYLNRTWGTPTNNKIWTYSCWVKLGDQTNYRSQVLSSGITGSPVDYAMFQFVGVLNYQETINSTPAINVSTVAIFRDPAAWYHTVLAVDTTQTTATNRVRIYVNGVLQAVTIATQVSQNTDTTINKATRLGGIGALAYAGSYINNSDGYMAEVNFIDGQALTPNSFGTFNSFGVWQPIVYGGSYGTNGFYLPFSNNASTTTLGLDFSPQGNNWTTNNISVTAGSTYDSMTDVPTLTSTTAANYCVLNPLPKPTNTLVFSNGNLNLTVGTPPSSSNNGAASGTMAVSSGKWYWEITAGDNFGGTANFTSVGIGNLSTINSTGDPHTAGAYMYYANGNNANGLFIDGTSGSSYGVPYKQGNIIGVALDLDTNQITWYVNNSSQGVKTITANTYVPRIGGGIDVGNIIANFGQRPFTYTPPSGFLPLNTFNL